MKSKLNTKLIHLTSDFTGLLHSLKSNKDHVTILLDEDSRLDYFLSEIEYNGLSKFLKKYDISLADYVEPINRMLITNNLKISFSGSSYCNLLELYRKLEIPSVDLNTISRLEFHENFNQLIEDIVDFLSRGESLKYQLCAILKRNYYVYNLLIPLIEALSTEFDKRISFRYSSQVLSSNSFSNNVSEVEVMFFIISLISQSYRLDNKKMTEQLYFALKNGSKVIHKTSSLKLSSETLMTNDKLLSFKQLHLFNRVDDISFALDGFQSYSSVLLSGKLVTPGHIEHLASSRFFYSDEKYIGSDTTHVEIFIDNSLRVFFTYYYIEMSAAKESFYIQQAKTKFIEVVNSLTVENIDFEALDVLKGPFLYRSSVGSVDDRLNRNCYFIDKSKASRYSNHSINSNLYMGKTHFIQSLLK